MKIIKGILFVVCFALLTIASAEGQEQGQIVEKKIEIYFDPYSYEIDPTYLNSENQRALLALSEVIDSLNYDPEMHIKEIIIESYSQMASTTELAHQRTNSLYSHIQELHHLSESLFTLLSGVSHNHTNYHTTTVTIYYERVIKTPPPTPEQIPEITTTHYENTQLLPVKEDFMAIKTNLLYDMALATNFALEFPVGDRWSIELEFLLPWYSSKSQDNVWQGLSSVVRGKYWFRANPPVEKLTGWYAGVYLAGGTYDICYGGSGYQGDYFVSAGLSVGYGHTINSSGSLRLEYGVSVGYLRTDYCHYLSQESGKYLVWQYDARSVWFGATEAKVSLVWMLRGKGGKR